MRDSPIFSNVLLISQLSEAVAVHASSGRETLHRLSRFSTINAFAVDVLRCQDMGVITTCASRT